MLPNFLVIGAAKSGTTSLYHYLKQHPEIYMSPVKEPYFFSFINKKPKFKGPLDENVNKIIITKLEDYERLFKGVTTEKAIGECSNSYLYLPESAYNIKKIIPDCKIIIILRNPVERAYSHYMQSVMIRKENLPFDEAIKKEDERRNLGWVWFFQYTGQSMYYKQVKQYLDLFGEERVNVYLFDELKKDPIGLMKKIYNFLEVDNNFVPKISIENKSGKPKSKILMNLLITDNQYKRFIKIIFPKNVRGNIYKYLFNKNISSYSIDEEVKKELISRFYNDIISLEKLIKKDLKHWLY